MGYKSRGNFPLGYTLNDEEWDKIFPKEKKEEDDKKEQPDSEEILCPVQ